MKGATSGLPAELHLRKLMVLDRLKVGPVQLEPDRLVAPYTVVRDGVSESTELIYKYQEPVFDPADLQARNLASLIASQVALNYGLFCKELVLHGAYSERDRRFLTEMARNTAREIYVIKLQMPNPFLRGEAAGLPLERLEDYLQARLRFEGEAVADPGQAGPWGPDRRRIAVLSSGGKDSLLSYGLLRELGQDVHPLYVNESGRHWYTALNAHRHMAAADPLTSRVWTSADRVFSWMLRRLPFVRQDFAELRSDEYPLRLWTVAVFLFGVLPLLRRRGIGRLVIGDEFDTTTRLSFQGISHYGGLYDQSRYFDNALSRYFLGKGWGLAQFSVLRPLSELLILKVLAERYPDLQQHQVSCHASHLEEGRALPCGRCEKCRRIISMLMGLGGDPTRCGYSQDQVGPAIEAMAARGLHQETAGAEHVAHLLLERGLLPGSGAGVTPRLHPEVLKLRFDREHSPADTIPRDLRGPLHGILAQHAEGAVQRKGRVWVAVDPLSDELLTPPYRFEGTTGPTAGGGQDDQGYLWGELSWPRAGERLKQVDVALLPVGAVEQHGPHLPLDVDAFDADRLCRDVAERCTLPRPLVLPLIPYGVSYHHDDFPGTISIAPATLAQVVYEVGMAVARQGISKLVIINGHGGNDPALNFAAQMINRDARIFTCVDTGETSDAEVDALAETDNDVHAGEVETSTTMALRPELVHLDLARRSVPRFSSEYLEFSSKKGVKWYVRTSRISSSGVMGDPTRAGADKGRKMWEIMVQNLVALVEDLKGLPLEGVYQRRY